MGFFVFLIDLFRQTARSAYFRLREFYYRFFSEVPIIDERAQYINESITIRGPTLPTGTVEVIYASLPGLEAVDNAATGTALGAGNITVTSQVPDNAVSGLVKVRQGGVESLLSLRRLEIRNPVIDSLVPPGPLIEPIALVGHGFSDVYSHTVSFGSVPTPAGRSTDGSGHRLPSLTIPPAAPSPGDIVVVVNRPSGGDLTSRPFPYYKGRVVGDFMPVEFHEEGGCGDLTLAVDPPDGLVQNFTVMRGGRPVHDGSFQVHEKIGGVALSPLCGQLARLSFIGGSTFELEILDTHRWTRLRNLTDVLAATGFEAFREPKLYFSTDCTIVALISVGIGGGRITVFYDLLDPGSRGVLGRGVDERGAAVGEFPDIPDFSAQVTNEVESGRQMIHYAVGTGRTYKVAIKEPETFVV
ncbi:MAG TPA: hypothetical protein VN696_05065 [Pyrinomonadaceae bacterium]|nr:hypothetical protein [Pyrinomonadaceae bacterium]